MLADGVTPIHSVEELYRSNQYVSLHIPATAETKKSTSSSIKERWIFSFIFRILFSRMCLEGVSQTNQEIAGATFHTINTFCKSSLISEI